MQKSILMFVLPLIFFVFSCSSDNGSDNEEDGPGLNPTPTTYHLGGRGPGNGIIFYLDENQHGLECSEPLSYNVKFHNDNISYPILFPVITNTDGMVRTQQIVDFFGNQGVYAAKLCSDFVQNNKEDWYLPTTYELSQLQNFYLTYRDVNMSTLYPFVDSTHSIWQIPSNLYFWSSVVNSSSFFNGENTVQVRRVGHNSVPNNVDVNSWYVRDEVALVAIRSF